MKVTLREHKESGGYASMTLRRGPEPTESFTAYFTKLRQLMTELKLLKLKE